MTNDFCCLTLGTLKGHELQKMLTDDAFKELLSWARLRCWALKKHLQFQNSGPEFEFSPGQCKLLGILRYFFFVLINFHKIPFLFYFQGKKKGGEGGRWRGQRILESFESLINTVFIFALFSMAGGTATQKKERSVEKTEQSSGFPDSYCPEALRSISQACHKSFTFQF